MDALPSHPAQRTSVFGKREDCPFQHAIDVLIASGYTARHEFNSTMLFCQQYFLLFHHWILWRWRL